MIGLNAKTQALPKFFEPYKCCPVTTTKKKETKLKQVSSSRSSLKKNIPVKRTDVKNAKKIPSTIPEKSSKGKKGLFGSGKYIWWW